MSREREDNFGAVAGGSSRSDGVDASGIRAQASGYADADYLKTGNYFDLNSTGDDISPTQSEFVVASVPPGNSFNEDHYATDDGAGATVSEASSELIAAVLWLEGEMRSSVTCDMNQYDPSGFNFWSGSASIDDPSTEQCDNGPCDWWNYVYFYQFTGRDFSHGGNREVDELGTYTFEFDTNYGTYSKDVEVVGPILTTCDTPSTIQKCEAAEFGATISKNDNSGYNGEVVVAQEMTDSVTERNVIHREPVSISQPVPVRSVSFDVPASKFDQFGGVGSDTNIMMWYRTFSI